MKNVRYMGRRNGVSALTKIRFEGKRIGCTICETHFLYINAVVNSGLLYRCCWDENPNNRIRHILCAFLCTIFSHTPKNIRVDIYSQLTLDSSRYIQGIPTLHILQNLVVAQPLEREAPECDHFIE